jgi:hypothetical protein
LRTLRRVDLFMMFSAKKYLCTSKTCARWTR